MILSLTCIADVLPHVLFCNQQVPWQSPLTSSDPTIPRLGLLVFTEDELALPPDQLDAINKVLGQGHELDRTSTLASSLMGTQLQNLSKGAVVYEPMPASDPGLMPLKVIFLQSGL